MRNMYILPRPKSALPYLYICYTISATTKNGIKLTRLYQKWYDDNA